ncbi:thioredoxin domain-containing protein, partial [Vibrio genomosp. F10]|uniref:thioredoxin domain-containing protein n=1 Tax=Vibrio genomosp. F10 TaxID=723171 RepID=UPI0003621CAA
YGRDKYRQWGQKMTKKIMQKGEVNNPVKKRRTMAHWIKECLFYIVFVSLISIGVDLWRSQDMPSATVTPIQALSMEGKYIDVMEMSKEKPVVVYFWATWCSACQFVTPTINRLGDSYHVVGVSGASGEDRKLAGFLRTHGYQFSNINDSRNAISRAWGVTVTPTIVIINNEQVTSITTGITTPPGLYARLWLSHL